MDHHLSTAENKTVTKSWLGLDYRPSDDGKNKTFGSGTDVRKRAYSESHHSQRRTFNSARSLVALELETFAPQSASQLNLSNDDTDNHSNDAEDKPIYRTDSGYAWIILIAVSLIMPVAGIPITTSGMFYVEFRDSFHNYGDATLWACSFNAALVYLIGPFAAILVEKTSARICAMIGCAGMGLSLAVAAFTTNFQLFFLTYAVLSASFGSCMYIPACTFAAYHFKKHRQLALIVPTVCGGSTFLTIPPIIAFFLSYYGWREACLLISAISLQVTIMASLLREPERLNLLPDSSEISSGSDSYHSSSSSQSDSIVTGGKLNKSTRSTRAPTALDKESEATNLSQSTDKQTIFSQIRPLIHWRMIALLSKSFIRGWSGGVYYVLVPYYVQQFGVTVEQTTHLYMVGGICNIGIRMVLVALGRCKDYNKTAAAFVGLMSVSAGLLGFTIYPSNAVFLLSAALFSIGQGMIASLANPVILEMHGMYRIELVFGLEMMFVGFASLLAPPFTEQSSCLNGWSPLGA